MLVTKMSVQKKYWLAVLVWTLLIFSLMLEGRPLINLLKIYVQFPLLIFSVYAGLAGFLVLFLFHTLALRRPLTYLLLGVTFIVYTLLLVQVKELEEIAHFVEYGILSCLVYLSLAHGRKSSAKWVFAFLLASAIGILEETLQLWVPTRVFDLHDILKNVLAVFFGLVFTAIVEHEKVLDAGSSVP